MKRTLSVAKKEIKHILRDPRRLYLSFVIPLMMLLIFGYAIKFDVKNILIGFCNYDNGSFGQRLIERISGNDIFQISEVTSDFNKLKEGIEKGNVEIGVVIPPTFTKKIKRNQTSKLQIIIDGSNPTVARLGTSYLGSIIMNIYKGQIGYSFKTIKIIPKILYNIKLESTNFVVPGLIAVIMTMISCLLTALTIVGEWEKGTMEMLLTTPVKSREVIIGKLLPYIAIAFIDCLVVLFVAVFIFGVPFRGNFVILIIATFVFLCGGLGVGLLLSTLVKQQQLVIQLAWLVSILPSVLLSGFMFPVESMPRVIQYITYFIPARYFIVIIRNIMLKGTGFLSFYKEFIFLFIFGVFTLSFSIYRFNRERN